MHRDIDVIMADMRKAHLGQSDSAPGNSAAEELKQDLEEVARFNGSKLEQLIMLFCKQTKLLYNKLTEEEKQWRLHRSQNCWKVQCRRGEEAEIALLLNIT